MATKPKDENKQPNNSGAGPQIPAGGQQMNTRVLEAVICPAEVWEQITIALRKLPIEDIEPLYLTVKAMRPQPVSMQMPPG